MTIPNQSKHGAAFTRFITHFKLVKVFVFAVPLFAALVVSQLLIRGIGHALPPAARRPWLPKDREHDPKAELRESYAE